MRTIQRWLAILPLLAFAAGSPADELRGVLRVGTSGDYAPFSWNAAQEAGDGAPPAYEGFDIAVARAYAAERGLEIEWVRFYWPKLLASLQAGRFDVAMSGVTVRPERSAAGRFTVPVAETGAVVLVLEIERWRDQEGLDHPVARIGVNAGGHLEDVARRHFPRATLLTIPENAAVIRALVDGQLDAAVTDSAEAPYWLAQREGLTLLGPFTRDRKAYLVRADRPELAADLDDWLMARESDGTLARLRSESLGEETAEPTATPLRALMATMDERLSLMPLVGSAKREQGIPLEVPEREAIVLDAAVAGVDRAAKQRGVAPPPDVVVRALFRAQMGAAKRVQWEAVQKEELKGPFPDVDEALRPALLRIGERISTLLIGLPRGLDRERVLAAARQELRTPQLDPASIEAIADAVVAISAAEPAAPSAPGERPSQPAGEQRQ